MTAFKTSVLLTLASLFSVTLTAQHSDSLRIQQKLDSLIVMQKQLKTMQEDIYKSTVYVDPLIGKKFGVEVNPASLFAGNFSGGIQLFDVDRKAEVSIPVSYYKPLELFFLGCRKT